MVFVPALRDWTGGLFVTAAIMNAEIRDRLNTLLANTPQMFEGTYVRTKAANGADALKQVEIVGGTIVMNDGARVTGWERQTADITVAGPNGLDTGSEAASTWYEIHAIQKSSDGTKGLILHKANNPDAGSSQTNSDGFLSLRDASARTAVAQGIELTTGTSGVPHFVELSLHRVNTPTGNLWVTIETSSSGPSGTVIGTSDKIDVAKLSTSTHDVRLPIRYATTNMLTATQYYICVRGDFAISGANYVQLRTMSGNPYGSGVVYAHDGASWATSGTADFKFVFGALTDYGAVTMPSGYDRRQKIGYVYNGSGSDFAPFVQHGRRVIPLSLQTIASSISAGGIDAIHYLSTMVPAGALLVTCEAFGGVGGAGETILVGVPDGYEFTRSPRKGGAAFLSSGAASQRGHPDQVLTECQALYSTVVNTSADGAIYLSSWEWLS